MPPVLFFFPGGVVVVVVAAAVIYCSEISEVEKQDLCSFSTCKKSFYCIIRLQNVQAVPLVSHWFVE